MNIRRSTQNSLQKVLSVPVDHEMLLVSNNPNSKGSYYLLFFAGILSVHSKEMITTRGACSQHYCRWARNTCHNMIMPSVHRKTGYISIRIGRMNIRWLYRSCRMANLQRLAGGVAILRPNDRACRLYKGRHTDGLPNHRGEPGEPGEHRFTTSSSRSKFVPSFSFLTSDDTTFRSVETFTRKQTIDSSEATTKGYRIRHIPSSPL
jgi:hypothetical protein